MIRPVSLEKESLYEDGFYKVSLEILETEDNIIFRRLSEYCSSYTEKRVSKQELKEAIIKQRPAKPKKLCIDGNTAWICESCNDVIGFGDKYCNHCGQKEDWKWAVQADC